QLNDWSTRKHKSVQLPLREQNVSSALLHLARNDARSRVMVAGALSNPDAQRASGTEWFGPFLTRLLQDERYPAVRYLAHRGLRSVHGEEAVRTFDYLATPAQRRAQLKILQTWFDMTPIRRPASYLPLTAHGLPDDAVLRTLLDQRRDPDLTINE